MSVPGLLVARVLNGLGVGMVTATATAHLAELHAASRPEASARRAGVVATAANLGGLGLGSLVAGVLVQVAPHPLVTPYVVFLVLLLAVTVGLLVAPETVAAPGEPVRYRVQRIAVPPSAVGRYAGAAVAGFALFTVFGLFTSLAPRLLAEIGWSAPVVAGSAAFGVFGAATLSQIALGHLEPARQLSVGLTVTALGVVVLVTGVATGVAPVFLAGGLVAGAGAGLLLKGALGTAVALSDPERRGEATAGIFLASYAGLTLPVVGLGLLTTAGVALQPAVAGFGAVTLVVLGVAALVLARTREPIG